MGNSVRRVFVYGSCVARDTLAIMEREDPRSVQVVSYVARQSLLSVGSAAEGLEELAPEEQDLGLPHAFRRRMVRGDWAGNLWEEIEAAQANGGIDVLVWDLVDERFGVFVQPNLDVITKSIDLFSSPVLMKRVADAELVLLGTDEHFTEWAAAAERFAGRLRDAGLWDRAVVLAVPWAARDDRGREVPVHGDLTVDEANSIYERYYGHLAGLGFDIITVADGVVAGSEHQWGPAPFHYARSVYDQIITELEKRLH